MTDNKYYIDTESECGHIYINNIDGEHMSWSEVKDTLNNYHTERESMIKDMSTLLFILSFCKLPKDIHLSQYEIDTIRRVQEYVGEPVLDLKKFNNGVKK